MILWLYITLVGGQGWTRTKQTELEFCTTGHPDEFSGEREVVAKKKHLCKLKTVIIITDMVYTSLGSIFSGQQATDLSGRGHFPLPPAIAPLLAASTLLY